MSRFTPRGFGEWVADTVSQRPRGMKSTRAKAVTYALALLVQAGLFFLSSRLNGESEALFALIYVLSAILTTVFAGAGPGMIAGFLASLSVDFHYIRPVGKILGSLQGGLFFILTNALMQFVLLFLRLLQRSAERAKEAEARALEAVYAREEILSLVAHDLRQPLNSIAMRADLILVKRGAGAGASERKQLACIREDVKRLNRMIGDLVDFSRLETGQLSVSAETFDLARCVTKISDSLEATCAGRAIVIDSKSRALVWADPARVHQVMVNLITNALKYGDPRENIRVAIRSSGAVAEIIVANRGPGISSGQLEKIFERFARTPDAKSRTTDGLGLGLYIAKGLVEAQGGKIWAESDLGSETRFHFTLPRAGMDASRFKDHQRTSLAAEVLKDLRVLVVDDSEDQRVLLRAFLERAGARVRVAGSASEAVVRLIEFRPDVLVSDIEMPGADGFSLINQIHRLEALKRQHIPVVAMTAHSHLEDIEKIAGAGFECCLTKPVSFESVTAAVLRAARRAGRPQSA